MAKGGRAKMTNAVSPTYVLNYIKRILGSVLHTIELSDEEIMSIVFTDTLPTFSVYFPYTFVYKFKQEDAVEGRQSVFRIESELTITGIHQLYPSGGLADTFNRSAYNYNFDPFGAQMAADRNSTRVTPITSRFEPPNIINVFPKLYTYNTLLASVKAVHPKHLKTIKIGLRNEFLKLAEYDVLRALYPLRHRFENMSTPLGDIMPFLNQVDEAEDKRTSLLETWNSNVLKVGNARRVWRA